MLQFQQARLQRGDKVLFDDANFTIHAKQKVALTGANGCGKSSLFAVIHGDLTIDKGSMTRPKQCVINMIAQQLPSGTISALNYVLSSHDALAACKQNILTAEKQEDYSALCKHYEVYELLDGYRAESQAAILLHGLGFSEAAQQQPIDSFSGGWRVRLNIASALFAPCDLLLLDEPTNHLDLEAIIWLESWLQHFDGTLLLISHDRDFLDAIATHTLYMEHQRIHLYTGNYSAFEKQRAEKQLLQQRTLEKQQKVRQHLQQFVDRFRYKASKAKQAQSRMKALSKLENILLLKDEHSIRFDFLPVDKLPNQLITLRNAVLGYEHPVLTHKRFVIHAGDRIGLLGLNGAGKSTFIKTLAQHLTLLSGDYEKHPNCKIGYFAQYQRSQLDPQAHALAHLQRLANDHQESQLRRYLAGFGFSGDHVFVPTLHLSGGEKARLVLALMIWQRPNVLLLDEPTNHLDMGICESLTLALQNFQGALVVISHNRHLLKNTCDQFYLVDTGKINLFDGDLDDYKNWLQVKQNVSPATKTLAVAQPEKMEHSVTLNPKQKKALQHECQQLEKTLSKLQNKLEKVEADLADPKHYQNNDTNASNPLATLKKEHEQIKSDIEQAEIRWLTLSEQLQS